MLVALSELEREKEKKFVAKMSVITGDILLREIIVLQANIGIRVAISMVI